MNIAKIKIFGYRLIDIVNPLKWWAALKYKIQGDVICIPKDDAQVIAEIMVYRSISCPECAEAGACVSCGCPWPGKSSDPEDSCPEGKWDATTVDSWKKAKKGLGIKFKIDKG